MKRARSSKKRLGLLTEAQFRVLKERGLGYTQSETASHLGTTRASVSMLESRARKNVEKARATCRAYESTLSAHSLRIGKGTKIRDFPTIVLRAGDSYGIHLRVNIVDLLRLAKSLDKSFVRKGASSKDVVVTIMQTGKVTGALA